MYLVAETYENKKVVHRLHALDITTGIEKLNGPTTIAATYTLNGTTNTSGSLTTVVPGTTLTPTQLPLTAANALDVWNPVGSNRTSAAVLKALISEPAGTAS